MKKVLNKNVLLIVLVVINLSALIFFLIEADNSLSQTKLPKFSDAQEKIVNSVEFDEGSAYKVIRDDIDVFDEYEVVVNYENAQSVVVSVTSLEDIFIGKLIEKNVSFGKFNGDDVKIECDGVISEIESKTDHYDVTIINNSSLSFLAYIDYSEYESYMNKGQEIRLVNSSNTVIGELKFNYIDYNYGINNGYICVSLSLIGTNVLLFPGFEGTVQFVTGEIKDALYISKEAFNEFGEGVNAKTFLVNEIKDGEDYFKRVSVRALQIVGDYAVIKGEGVTGGTVLYLN